MLRHLTRREMMAGAALIGLANGLHLGRALAGTPQVLNETSGVVLHDLFTAIAAAKPGDVFVVSGQHSGQITLDKSLTLRGDASAVIDAGGQGHNRWDDGTLGNHYSDFDEAAEGFADADGDGVGEVAHPIPGGGHVDRYPLTAARVAAI